MRRVALAVLVVVACGCRRTHERMTYASDTPATPAPAAARTAPATPSGASPAPIATAPPAASRARASLPDGGTLNGDPRGPRPAEWQAVLDGAMPALQGCFDRANLPPGTIPVTMHFTVERPGYTGAVTARGAAPREVLDCCEKVVEDLKFPEYRGDKVERDLAFTWQKRLLAPDGGAAAKKP